MKDQSQQPGAPKPGVTGSTTQPFTTGPASAPPNSGSWDPVLNPTGTGGRDTALQHNFTNGQSTYTLGNNGDPTTNPASRGNNTLTNGTPPPPTNPTMLGQLWGGQTNQVGQIGNPASDRPMDPYSGTLQSPTSNGTNTPTPPPGTQTDPTGQAGVLNTFNSFPSSSSSGPIIGGATAALAGLSPSTGTSSSPPPPAFGPVAPYGSPPPFATAPQSPSQPFGTSQGARTTDIAQAPGQMGNQWGNVNSQLDLSKLPSMVTGDALRGMTTDASNNAYKQATGYLDPQWQNQQTTLQNTLANQGVMQNSEAWNKAMDDFARQKEFAYGQARDASFNQGLTAQNQLFSQGLQGNQNAFSQQLSNAQLGNTAQNQIANQGLTASQIAEQLQAAQTAANAQIGSASIGANASMSNVAAQLSAAREQNQFSNSLTMRNQGINELLLQQRNPIDIANLLNQGSNVTSPQFPNTPNSSVNPTDLASLINQAYQGQLNGYNAQTGNTNSNNAAMASIIAAIICDRRMKTDIRLIGMHERGFPLYEFRYLWSAERMVGPMADEVAAVVPEAIIDVAGIQAVNMAMLEAA